MRPLARARVGGLAIALGASLALLAYACTSDDSGGSSGTIGGTDSSFDGTTGSSGGESGPGEGDGATDGGIEGGGIKAPVTTCTPLSRLDSLGNVSAFAVSASSFGGKYLFTWTESSDNSHFRGRYFDGSKLTNELDFGLGFAETSVSSVDATGKAYLMWEAPATDPDLAVFDLTTGTIASSINVPLYQEDLNFGVGGLPAGGALALYQTRVPTQVVNIDRYVPGMGWTADAGADAGVYPTDLVSDNDGIALNPAGKGAAFWNVVTTGPNGHKFTVLPFDGAKLGDPVARTFVSESGSGDAIIFSGAALANGDVAFVWRTNAETDVFSIFHPGAPAGSEWDPDMQLGTTANGGGNPLVLVGAGDAITAVWNDGATLKARRRLGGVWSAAITLGASVGNPIAALDPGGNIVFATASNQGTISVGRIPADSTTVPPLVQVALEQPGVAIAFDSAGDPVVGGLQNITSPPPTVNQFAMTTCTAGP